MPLTNLRLNLTQDKRARFHDKRKEIELLTRVPLNLLNFSLLDRLGLDYSEVCNVEKRLRGSPML